ncbi:MAG TPA: HAMP domain-containing sensor histidine kinase [Solirubrobacteraceae bacterium]|nr:HAMP domain-containing sensor histidine kinase [Solirubrobacteraceae bacterium]
MSARAQTPRGLHSIKNRLALLFFAITFAALVLVYAIVTPGLGAGLRTQRLRTLQIAAQAYSHRLESAVAPGAERRVMAAAVHHAAQLSNDRVTLFGVRYGGPSTPPDGSPSTEPASPTSRAPRIFPIDDSAAEAPGERVGSLGAAIAARVVSGHRLLTGTSSADGPVGEAAKPLFYGDRVVGVAVFSGTLSDVERSVAQIRERILIAGAIALALSLAVGYLLARAISLRVGRLEEAAWQVAEGDFSARFPVDSPDELGQLAGALGSMQRQLAELDRARERFIATASHELRTPIFSLGGFLELLQDEDLDAQTRRQFIGQVRAQVERLGQLATGLLDLSRLEAGALELREERVDLGEIAQMVCAEFIPALSQHDSQLRQRVSHEPVLAGGDPERVAQILRIMIDNAISHTPQGTAIVVSASRTGEEARLAVRDFGPGIEGSSRERIFEPFYTSAEGQGSGLGLAIAHELAERMGGKLSVESSPGRTVFTLALPT